MDISPFRYNRSAQNLPGADEHARFISMLRESLSEGTFVKLTLGTYRGKEPEMRQIRIKRIDVKDVDTLSFVLHYRTRDITKNAPTEEGIDIVSGLLGWDFRSANLFTTTRDVQIEFSKKGKALMREGGSTHTQVPSRAHDRERRRLIDQTAPFLRELGITDAEGSVIPSMSRKWKQINKFVELYANAYESIEATAGIHVVDFGSGKGYLTFAVHHYLTAAGSAPEKNRVTGVELRPDLVEFCNGVAERLSLTGLEFHEGDIGTYEPEKIDVMIALHACDIATDLAMHKGIAAGARIIMCAPCCHKEIRPQMHMPDALQPLLRHGVHLGQEADMVTDSLRAMQMELHGYTTRIFEFVSLEHTSKNKMILGVKRADASADENLPERIRAIKEFYGIRTQALERLLAGESIAPPVRESTTTETT